MLNWFKEVWNDDDERRGIIGFCISFIICLFVVIMFGVDIFKPSPGTGFCYFIIFVISFIVYFFKTEPSD